MASKKKLLQAAAGSAGGAGLDVDEVFKNHLWIGTGSSFSVNNGIDLSGEGGLVWIKNRGPNAANHAWYDTVRGVRNYLMSNSMADQDTASSGSGLTAFNSNGFNIGSGWVDENNNGQKVVSWTFRKAEGFFDLMTWTGNGASNRAISHNLGSVPGMIIVKRYAGGNENWAVWHRDIHSGSSKVIYLDQNGAKTTSNSVFSQTNPTSTDFYVGNHPLSNNNGDSYVAWVFAHNNNDGEFGPDSDQDIIKCGSYYGNGSTNGPSINLGFEPQWLMVKRAGGAGDWQLHDSMRGQPIGQTYPNMSANSSSQEITDSNRLDFTSTGFKIVTGNNNYNGAGTDYIYMAIRRGPLAEPESATDVFAVQDGRGADKLFTAGFPVDTLIVGDDTGDNWQVKDRLRGQKDLHTNSTASESNNTFYHFDDNTGIVKSDGTGSAIAQLTGYMWKRAPGFFDVAHYFGNAQASAITVNHNLGVVPEMMWCKKRGATGDWMVYHKDLNGGTNPHTYRMRLNSTGGEGVGSGVWNAAPTATQFSVGTDSDVNADANIGFITYLFATVAGISKVGSYTGDGNAGRVIDCGFSNGARFVLARSYTHADNWFVFDSERGIVAGNDPYLRLNTTDAEITNADLIDVHSSGFIVNNANGELNDTGRSYIFYAIAA